MTWREEAACLNLPVDPFFPEQGQSAAPAKKICATCPVRNECLDYAMTTGQEYGVWGGLTEDERHELRRGRGNVRPRAKRVDHQLVIDLLQQGHSAQKIADHIGCHVQTVFGIQRDMRNAAKEA